MRAVEVRDFLNGQGWFDLVQHRLSPDHPFAMHWSRLADLPLAGLDADVPALDRSRHGRAHHPACRTAAVLSRVPAGAVRARAGSRRQGAARSPSHCWRRDRSRSSATSSPATSTIMRCRSCCWPCWRSCSATAWIRRRPWRMAWAGARRRLVAGHQPAEPAFRRGCGRDHRAAVGVARRGARPRAALGSAGDFAWRRSALFLVQVPPSRYFEASCDAFGAPHLLGIAVAGLAFWALAGLSARLRTPQDTPGGPMRSREQLSLLIVADLLPGLPGRSLWGGRPSGARALAWPRSARPCPSPNCWGATRGEPSPSSWRWRSARLAFWPPFGTRRGWPAHAGSRSEASGSSVSRARSGRSGSPPRPRCSRAWAAPGALCRTFGPQASPRPIRNASVRPGRSRAQSGRLDLRALHPEEPGLRPGPFRRVAAARRPGRVLRARELRSPARSATRPGAVDHRPRCAHPGLHGAQRHRGALSPRWLRHPGSPAGLRGCSRRRTCDDRGGACRLSDAVHDLAGNPRDRVACTERLRGADSRRDICHPGSKPFRPAKAR